MGNLDGDSMNTRHGPFINITRNVPLTWSGTVSRSPLEWDVFCGVRSGDMRYFTPQRSSCTCVNRLPTSRCRFSEDFKLLNSRDFWDIFSSLTYTFKRHLDLGRLTQATSAMIC
ncbi:hypothetical protein TNCT_515891 [Trichonephila clavata]|uniref:Uncharacterized protein n=1 Tax=Trichonephila clavata TaxID=2740835 RepID=A0A8X6JEJ9_TRICU|nr:hypothetical protein TNCT_515891 [Trichonephila clavata]